MKRNETIENLQRKIGVNPDGDFGPKTAKAFMAFFGLNQIETAHLLGQCHHESNGFTRMVENLNYSGNRLLQIFPRYFDKVQAKYYAMKPEAIANKVYQNRMGNGAYESGDGWKYRGRGPLQITGKNNYRALSEHFSNGHILLNPDLVVNEYAFESAIWFFRHNQIFNYCHGIGDSYITQVSKAVNLGNPNSKGMPHGLSDRIAWTLHYFNLLSRG